MRPDKDAQKDIDQIQQCDILVDLQTGEISEVIKRADEDGGYLTLESVLPDDPMAPAE